MRFISWNVNGVRACMQKGFMDFFKEMDADVFCPYCGRKVQDIKFCIECGEANGISDNFCCNCGTKF